MPYPMKPDNNLGSETGIEAEKGYAPEERYNKRKNDFDWLASIRNIFNNIVEIVKMLFKWR